MSEELFPEVPESLEDQDVELTIVLSIQPFSSRSPPAFDTGSSTNLGPESPENPVQTLKKSLTTDGHLGLVIYPPNPLFDPVVISPQRRPAECSFGTIRSYLFDHSSSFVFKNGTPKAML